MKNIFLTTALVVLSAPAFASGTINVGDGGTGHYNDASINKGDTDNSLTNGDHLNNTYAPDSATSDASASVGDIITQGGSGTGGNAHANGNQSHNNNQSSANNDLRNQQFGNSQNANANHQGDQTFKGSNDQSQGQGQAQNSTSHGGNQSQSANNSGVTTNVNNSTRVKQAARSAIAPSVGGYGPQNCFGDTHPSGSFTAGVQVIEWGVSAGAQKASNVCAIVAIGGPRAGAAYLAQVDPNARKALIAAGIVTTPQQVRAQAKAAASQPAPQQVVRCPEGSSWDGKGCWASNLAKVRR